ncbi:hypothetical protein M378DRAFT_823594 [Amanita muscaria Koide BX008]|uniref:Protein kinase domain-containing protein n=1 Tax=Amanita muscaria (strain Koide BX008) TaxID=946122 RepID=A0A0C2XGZ5_AMAMK|nr:hypothetical protein M378DRAFT_823594 [Amanita muscaria Koide BX008]
MWRVLDKNYIHLDMELLEDSLIAYDYGSLRGNTWRQILPLDSNTVIEIVLDVATAIQYFHSMGFMPSPSFTFGDVYLDLSLRPRIRFDAVTVIKGFDEEESIFAFGCFFYAAYFNIDTVFDTVFGTEEQREIIVERPSSPKIPEYAWQLIQRCCAEDSGSRPTIEQVVKEMETWRIK